MNAAKISEAKALLGIPEDEPVFILRGQDAIGAATVKFWVEISVGREVPAEKIAGAVVILRSFEAFKKSNPGRVKQPD